MTMVAQDNESSGIGRRTAARLRLGIPARLLTLDGSAPCQLLDLSRHGARIATEQSLTVGADAVLQCLGFEAFGTIVWTNSQRVGMKFDEELDEQRMLQMRDYKDNYAEWTQAELRLSVHDWVSGRSRLI